MPASRDDLFAFLDQLGIETTTVDHPPVYTVEEAKEHWEGIPGVHCKNLFLRDKKAMFLVVCPHDRIIDLKALGPLIGGKRLSFGSAERLGDTLGVEPGSVTPFSIINDRDDHKVTVILDAEMMAADKINFHPLENTATTTISSAGLRAFIAACGHDCRDVDLRQMQTAD